MNLTFVLLLPFWHEDLPKSACLVLPLGCYPVHCHLARHVSIKPEGEVEPPSTGAAAATAAAAFLLP